MCEQIVYHPIGIIYSDHTVLERTPIQPVFAADCPGRAELLPEFAAGLADLEGFSHIYLIYHLHQATRIKLTVKPFLQDVEHGVFATRAPCRPNPIGISIVELIGREDNVLHLAGIDILNGTPLLDIKPYCGRFDRLTATRDGWQSAVDDTVAQALGRRGFQPPE